MSEDSANQAIAGRDVFVSYASQDVAVAKAVVEALEQQGIRCWMAPRDVKPGAAYADAIVRAINEASALVLVLSGAAMASEHVSREVERAGSKRKPIVAFRVDAASLSAELEYFLSRSQWIDVPALGMPAALVKLAEAVGQGSAAAQANAVWGGGGAAGRASIEQAVGTASVARRVVVAAAVVIALGVGGVLAVRFWKSKHGESQAPAVAAIPDKSIAVLPFVDMSERHDQEYFGDGMAEEILNLLVTIPELKVIGRTSSFRFKDKTDDLRAIGTALGATYVVEGSVRRSGDHARVTAQLIDTRDGAHRWSETYDRDARDVLKVQADIATNLVRALQLEVATSNHFQSKESLRNSEAYENYLHGLHARDRYDQGGFEEAVVRFRHALDIDPSFVPAAELLALSLRDLADWGFVPPKTGWEQARAAANAALKLDPNSAAAHAVLGRIHTDFDWDWPAAAREVDTSVTLAPNTALVLYLAATERLAIGQFGEASHFLDAARTADPLDPTVHLVCGWVYLRLGRLAEAETAHRRVLEISPTYVGGHYFLGIALLTEGKTEAALTEMQLETLVGGQFAGLAAVYSALHRAKEADLALARLEADDAADMALQIAEVYAVRGKKDRAFAWLDRAYAQKDINLFLFKGDPLLKTLEQDSRYKAFLKKMNFPE